MTNNISNDLDFESAITTNVPHSREAEEATIGAVFIDPVLYWEIAEFLKPEHFYIHRHKWIWETFVKLNDKRSPVDLLTVADELERHGKLSEIGGPAYLTALVNQSPTSLNAIAHAKIVHAYAFRRRMIETANRMASIAYDGAKDPFSELSKFRDEIEDAQEGVVVEEQFQPLSSVMSDVYDELDERSKNPMDVWGIPTGLAKVDYETGGQQPGELTWVVGEPGIGKTWLELGLALDMAKFCPGGFLSMELKRQNVARRILSGTSGVSTRAIRSGNVRDGDWPLITHAIDTNSDLPLYLMYDSVTSDQLYHIVRQAKRKYGLGFLIVDYAMLFTDEAKDDTERTGMVSRNLKKIAVKFDIAIHCIHSVIKTGMDGDGDPAKSYMRGSGQQIHDADNIFFLTKYHQTDPKDGFLREEDTKRMATFWCKKGRELENSDFHIHLVRKGKSPFFAEYSRVAAQQERGLIPQTKPAHDWQDRKDIGDD